MAVIKKNGSTMGLPGNITRGNPIPLDSTTIWYSLQEAQNYAQNGVTAYVGQILSVVNETNETATAYMIINEDGDLMELGASSSSPSIDFDSLILYGGSATDVIEEANNNETD